MIKFEGGTFEIDATTIADGLEIAEPLLQQRMRDGTLTSRSARGIETDEGRYRLTFFTEQRRLQRRAVLRIARLRADAG